MAQIDITLNRNSKNNLHTILDLTRAQKNNNYVIHELLEKTYLLTGQS